MNLQHKINSFHLLCNNLNLSFNPEKTKFLNICRGSKKTFNITCQNQSLQQVQNLNFLGRNISASLAVSEHYKVTFNKSQNNSYLFKCLTSVKAGLHPRVALNYYKAIVRSKIEYCRSSMANCAKTADKKIQTFQNSFLRRALGLTPSTPVPLDYALANELPPCERAKWLTAKEIMSNLISDVTFKSFLYDCPRANSSYSLVLNEFKHVFDGLNVVCSTILHNNLNIVMKTLPDKKDNISSERIRSIYNSLVHDYKRDNFKIFFTDASVGDSSTGIAIYNHSNNTEHAHKLPFQASSSFGESLAILRALEIAKELKYDKIVIFTDSLIACQLLMKGKTHNHIILAIHNLATNEDFDNVTINWTPSHKGIAGNERADTIAKNAINCHNVLDVSLTPEEALRRIRNEINDQCAKPKNNWFKSTALSAKETKLINRILTGHTYDQEYLFKIKAITSSRCSCGDPDNFIHQTFHCPLLGHIREGFDIFQDNQNFHDIFHGFDRRKITSLANFLIKAEVKF
ncbi:PREDICTED: uncharacterized protein LOC108360301 [Rhagoletis zephyria]|uniref:uncharacterized protein LOC108360301 n=1 Tax=Rhagoletis zephyria TaxID=28612 RepID=UPI0008112DEB|nr:PREDICTED: uncharacterized protein LOC108360301 [Rhagoletis zephyria]